MLACPLIINLVTAVPFTVRLPVHRDFNTNLFCPFLGGANEAVIRMLISIGSPDNVPAFVEAVKRREKVLSGFGHR